MDLGIKGKVALVLAASKGLGRASAAVLAAEGVQVVIGSRNRQVLEKTVQEIQLVSCFRKRGKYDTIWTVFAEDAFSNKIVCGNEESNQGVIQPMTSSLPIPQDNRAYRFPVSIKGIIYHDEKVVLLKNERDEWELPGGKLELGEAPEICVLREIQEELGLVAQSGPLLDAWVYHIFEGVDVLILTYGCYTTPFSEITHSPEHKAVGQFSPEEAFSLRMPDGYKKSISTWLEYLKHS